MSQIVNTLPALPDDMPYDNYLLFRRLNTDDYFISNFDYLISDKLDANGIVHHNKGSVYIYNSSSNSWDFYGHSVFYPDIQLIASTVDIYNSDGSFYCSATEQNYFSSTISLISTSITSSTLTSVLNETKIFMPILVVALIAIIAFRKSWNFLEGAIRGV